MMPERSFMDSSETISAEELAAGQTWDEWPSRVSSDRAADTEYLSTADAVALAADQANFEYPPRIVPYTGFPDYNDEDDDGDTNPASPAR